MVRKIQGGCRYGLTRAAVSEFASFNVRHADDDQQ